MEQSLFPVFVLAMAIFFDSLELVSLASYNLGSGFIFIMSDVFRAQSLRQGLNLSLANQNNALYGGGFLCWVSVLLAFVAAAFYFEKKSDVLL